MISMLAMAAMVSCTNEIENPDQPQVNQNEPTPIEFGSSILGVQTKAAPGETAEAFDVGEIMGITMYLGEVPTGASLGTPSKDNVLAQIINFPKQLLKIKRCFGNVVQNINFMHIIQE